MDRKKAIKNSSEEKWGKLIGTSLQFEKIIHTTGQLAVVLLYE
jgi:hypothetical protein